MAAPSNWQKSYWSFADVSFLLIASEYGSIFLLPTPLHVLFNTFRVSVFISQWNGVDWVVANSLVCLLQLPLKIVIFNSFAVHLTFSDQIFRLTFVKIAISKGIVIKFENIILPKSSPHCYQCRAYSVKHFRVKIKIKREPDALSFFKKILFLIDCDLILIFHVQWKFPENWLLNIYKNFFFFIFLLFYYNFRHPNRIFYTRHVIFNHFFFTKLLFSSFFCSMIWNCKTQNISLFMGGKCKENELIINST